jgi:D-alanyl-D-alanine carboxypeptidase
MTNIERKPQLRRRAWWLLGFGAVVVGVGVFATQVLGPLSRAEAEAKLDQALADIVEGNSESDVRSAVLWVDTRKQGIDRGFAHGIANVAEGTAMTTETPFLSASVGKLFVAAAVMKLVADGRLNLDTPLTRFVSEAELSGLPVEGGDAALPRLTVALLLSHRTGLPDYFSDASRDGAPRLFDRIAEAPNQTWTRAQMLDYARAHYAPVGPVGGAFHYADTNYDLLGMVLEGVTGKPFHVVVRELVLDPLQLSHTWYHAFEPPPHGLPAPADVWVSGVNLRGAPALSVDQAGGGLVTTVGDLRSFLRSLVAGNPVALSVFETDFAENAMHAGIDVGRGSWRIRPGAVTFALSGMPTLVGHSGATGVWAYYVAEWDAVVVGAVSDSRWQERHVEFFLTDVIPTLARVRP